MYVCIVTFPLHSGSDDDDNSDDDVDHSKRKEISRGFVFDDEDDDVDGRALPVVVVSEKDDSRDALIDGPIDEADEERKEEDVPPTVAVNDDINQYGSYVVVTRKAYCVLSTHPQAAYPALFQV